MTTFERWLYTSILIWLAALSWFAFEVWPNEPFCSSFDLAVQTVLAVTAIVTALISLFFSRRP